MIMSEQAPAFQDRTGQRQYWDNDVQNLRGIQLLGSYASPPVTAQTGQTFNADNDNYCWWTPQSVSQSWLQDPTTSPVASRAAISGISGHNTEEVQNLLHISRQQSVSHEAWPETRHRTQWPHDLPFTHYTALKPFEASNSTRTSHVPTFMDYQIASHPPQALFDLESVTTNLSSEDDSLTCAKDHSMSNNVNYNTRRPKRHESLMSVSGEPPSLAVYSLNKSKSNWSLKEDAILLAAVERVQKAFDSPLPWSRVAESVEGRTSAMCSKRYKQLQRQTTEIIGPSYTRGPWMPEEDADLLATIEECRATICTDGLPLPWTKIGSMLKLPRSGLQVCARYTEALDPSIIRGRWTKEEDAQLLTGVSRWAGRWSLICQEIPGRTQRQCASRYSVLKGKARSSSK